ncbi:MAG: dTDP-4-dehydrorhamnose reductase [Alphaproteobacteria bacterium]|nr:dTDP-4-dehydrorhamnose reductase [Alphaproteobacteria bacterium]
MRILLLGSNGQVGWELQRSLSPLGKVIAYDRQKANLENLSALSQTILDVSPDIIVNAAAYTAVDQAESESDKAYLVNAKAVGVIAETAKKLNVRLVHYSTDYVFDGNKVGAYVEEDSTAPLNVYGKSKLAGEQAIIDSACDHYIFRTSWVYGQHGKNFIKSILRLAQNKDALKVVNDQYGAPTSAELIADVTAHMLKNSFNDSKNGQKKDGIYHLTSSGKTNWFEFSRYILDQAQHFGSAFKLTSDKITPITSEEFPLPAQRQKNSSLNVDKLSKKINLVMPDWRFHVSRTISQLTVLK